jgi:nucleotide-binding universal stress UspA family protein
MFSHFLVPISGDLVDNNHLEEIAKLAKSDTAKVTLVFVSDPMVPYMYMEGVASSPITEQGHKEFCEALAHKLFALAKTQLGGGLNVHTLHRYHTNIYEGIIQSAKECGADVIVMSSHKRKGLTGFFMGSETHAVITHSTLPILVL